MNKAKIVFIVLLLAMVGLVVIFLTGGDRSSGPKRPLFIHCAAGMKPPMTRIAKQYEKETGQKVELHFAGSGTLLGSLEVSKGDLYLAADSSYIEIARAKGWVQESIPVSYLRAGIGVQKGNPFKIESLDDLKPANLKVGFAIPEAASVGKFTKKILTESGHWDALEKKAHLMTGTVNELAVALKLGTIHAAVLWDAVANQYPDIDFVNVPEFDAEVKQITMGVLTESDQPTDALRFARYASARDRGLPIFEKDGYEIIDGDRWHEHPDILLYSGAMLRPAISEALKAFEEREGVTIRPVYNGCGILVSQMKAGEQPDAYFSCDIKFMDMVEDRFDPSVTVSGNDMVILTPKENKKGLQSLDDLTKPGIRLGLAHPDKSALGFLTKYMLEQKGIYQTIIDAGNLAVDSPTGDFLVNQLRGGSLDAIIVYRSNAGATPATLEECLLIETHSENNRAYQPYAVGRNSDYKFIMKRFFDQVVSQTSKDKFLSYGFSWELK